MAKATAFSIVETKDFAAVRDLAYRIWPVSYTNFLSPAQIDNMLARIYDVAALEREAAHGHRFLLAQEAAAPVGYASAYRDGDITWLKKLYLLPACRGSGLGAALLDAALALFPNAREQRLLVNPENHTARRFYEKIGFTAIGDMPVTMGDQQFVDLIYARPCAP